MTPLDFVGRTGAYTIYALPILMHWPDDLDRKLGRKADAVAGQAVREIAALGIGWPARVLYHYFEVTLGDWIGRFWLQSIDLEGQILIQIRATEGPMTFTAEQVPAWLREGLEEDG